jgi:hypothetical protein
MPRPPEWVYVTISAAPKPITIELPPDALEFRDAMRELVDSQDSIAGRVRGRRLSNPTGGDRSGLQAASEAFSALRDKAAEKSIVILRTPVGFALPPRGTGRWFRPGNSANGRKRSSAKREISRP